MISIQKFSKKSYSFKYFRRDLSKMLANRSSLRKTMKSGNLSSKFVKRLMLVVSMVNQCQYCSWAHTRHALKIGINENEINDIISMDYENVPANENYAMIFAQHYADTNGKLSPNSLIGLRKIYGNQKAKDIINVLQMISMANYLGNTIDAFESRISHGSETNGSFCFEFIIYVLAGGPLMRKMISKD